MAIINWGGIHNWPIDNKYISEVLTLNHGAFDDRESEKLEFKEQFSLRSLRDHYRSFAGFANNQGGYLIYGIQDSPRFPVGLTEKSFNRFKNIDPQSVTQDLLEIFSANIQWEQTEVADDDKIYGVFKIHEALRKPIIAKKNYGRNQSIKASEIYYRYAGRTQRIQYAELEAIIQGRIQEIIDQWMNLMTKIARIGPQNVALLDTEKRSLETGDNTILTIDEELFGKIKFIKEEDFSTSDGAETLKIVGDVVPIVEVIKKEKENLLSEYPLSATDLAKTVKELLPNISRNKVWETIKNNDMKNNRNYSAYNFRNRKQEELYKESGQLPVGIPSIYNHSAVDFIVTELKSLDSTAQANDQD